MGYSVTQPVEGLPPDEEERPLAMLLEPKRRDDPALECNEY